MIPYFKPNAHWLIQANSDVGIIVFLIDLICMMADFYRIGHMYIKFLK